MMLSTMLQSKILRTKKRLSNQSFLQPIYCIAFMGLMGCFGFALRAVTVSWNFGVVEAQIPVVHAPVEDKSFHRFRSRNVASIEKYQPTVFLTSKGLFFGTLDSFTKGYNGVRNKFKIDHLEGAPRLGDLMNSMKKWINDERSDGLPLSTEVLILVPAKDVPVSILIMVLDYFNKEGTFSNTVLAEGLL